jgi:hypothetical protein
MESLESFKKQWSESKDQEGTDLAVTDVRQIVKTRIKKEKKILFEYFWASYFWQFIIYISMTRLIIYFWGDWSSVLFCLTGILLYIPFTAVFIKKFTSMALKSNQSSQSVYVNLKTQWERISEFFLFKRRFDWLGIPVSCFIITLVIFKLWVPGGWEEHMIGSVIIYIITLVAFLIATLVENKKRFETPLYHLQQIMNEMQEEI